MSNPPNIKIGCVANLFSKQMHFFKSGDFEQGHTHAFDHLTLLAAGSLRVTVNGKATIFNAPQMIFIKAEHYHELEALENNTVAYCIHALRDGDRVEDILDPESIPTGVSPLTFAKKLTA